MDTVDQYHNFQGYDQPGQCGTCGSSLCSRCGACRGANDPSPHFCQCPRDEEGNLLPEKE